jgi:hypothetical protein
MNPKQTVPLFVSLAPLIAAAPFRVNPDAFQQFFARQMFHNVFNLAE